MVEAVAALLPRELEGHRVVMALMKRAVLLTSGETPRHVELMVDGPAPEDLDEQLRIPLPGGGYRTDIIPWTPRRGAARGRYLELFRGLSFKATGKRLALCEDVERDGTVVPAASRRDLYAMAKSLVATIEEHPPRCDWYPDGWRTHFDIIVQARDAEVARRAR